MDKHYFRDLNEFNCVEIKNVLEFSPKVFLISTMKIFCPAANCSLKRRKDLGGIWKPHLMQRLDKIYLKLLRVEPCLAGGWWSLRNEFEKYNPQHKLNISVGSTFHKTFSVRNICYKRDIQFGEKSVELWISIWWCWEGKWKIFEYFNFAGKRHSWEQLLLIINVERINRFSCAMFEQLFQEFNHITNCLLQHQPHALQSLADPSELNFHFWLLRCCGTIIIIAISDENMKPSLFVAVHSKDFPQKYFQRKLRVAKNFWFGSFDEGPVWSDMSQF